MKSPCTLHQKIGVYGAACIVAKWETKELSDCGHCLVWENVRHTVETNSVRVETVIYQIEMKLKKSAVMLHGCTQALPSALSVHKKILMYHYGIGFLNSFRNGLLQGCAALLMPCPHSAGDDAPVGIRLAEKLH